MKKVANLYSEYSPTIYMPVAEFLQSHAENKIICKNGSNLCGGRSGCGH